MKYIEKHLGDFKGNTVTEIEIINNNSNSISLWTLGARINKFYINPVGNIVLSYNDLEQLINNREYYLGATIGRIAGRISNSRFKLMDKEYKLDSNEGSNHLHGGNNGYDLKNWNYTIKEDSSEIKVIFFLKDKEKNNYYPGNLDIRVVHTFNEDNEWIVEYIAKSDKDTILNPANHVYFNLNGKESDICNHLLKIPSKKILETNEFSLPTGLKQTIEGTDIDFSNPVKLEKVFKSNHPEILKNRGLDTAYLIDKDKKITLSDYYRTIELSIDTDRDCVVVYTLNKIDNKFNMNLHPHQGVALETQSLPDAVNHQGFGNIMLKKDEKFYSKTKYSISQYI